MLHSAEEFVRLRTSDDPEEYGRAASEEAPLTVWLDVVERFPEMREWVAHNKTVPHEVLEILARDRAKGVRAVVASKRKLRPELQAVLAKDRDASVRHRLACNANCIAAVRLSLASDVEPFVREAAAARLRESGNAL
jgi:hypothetical protein